MLELNICKLVPAIINIYTHTHGMTPPTYRCGRYFSTQGRLLSDNVDDADNFLVPSPERSTSIGVTIADILFTLSKTI